MDDGRHPRTAARWPLAARRTAAGERQLAEALRQLADERDRLAEAMERVGPRLRRAAIEQQAARQETGRKRGSGGRFCRFEPRGEDRTSHTLHVGRGLWDDLDAPARVEIHRVGGRVSIRPCEEGAGYRLSKPSRGMPRIRFGDPAARALGLSAGVYPAEIEDGAIVFEVDASGLPPALDQPLGRRVPPGRTITLRRTARADGSAERIRIMLPTEVYAALGSPRRVTLQRPAGGALLISAGDEYAMDVRGRGPSFWCTGSRDLLGDYPDGRYAVELRGGALVVGGWVEPRERS